MNTKRKYAHELYPHPAEGEVRPLAVEVPYLYARAVKPYPCGPEPDQHDHLGDADARGWRTVNRVDGKESECADCCEPETATP